ncbi:type IV secretion protein Rhs [Pantoea alhagi]|uniref:Type IV secretion protein Rhs n=1 Tax=Pantoea alhagi TaxID=1891675 RepID=A0A1W6B3G5_9GAMM|nr:type IV secretion protein Rhs [Pantoea alhagi]ARJ41640.1 type IV secretion protein Rhs [Pantoea alhagi]
MKNGKQGSLRLMTPGEINMAKTIFGNAIIYSRVWIHYDSYFPFGLQSQNVAMAPNGEIYMRDYLYAHDFSAISDIGKQHTFIHELTHVWQYQKGMWVRTRGLFSWAASYHYDFNENKYLHDYTMEQQAQIVADYFLLYRYGYGLWLKLLPSVGTFTGKAHPNIKADYERVLTHFLRQR